ncbi:hypothetical protein E2320_004502, partial [Naja naja]
MMDLKLKQYKKRSTPKLKPKWTQEGCRFGHQPIVTLPTGSLPALGTPAQRDQQPAPYDSNDEAGILGLSWLNKLGPMI